MIRNGTRAYRGTFLAPAETRGVTSRNEYGQVEPQYIAKGEAYFAITQLTATQQQAAQQINPLASLLLTTRYMRSLKPTESWQIKIRDKTYHIVSINNVEERNETWQFVVGELRNG